ncbi:hypothetical protein Tco_0669920 [Tanacetum coccineum]
MACALPHTDSEVGALVQRLINEDKGRQDVLLNLFFQFKDSCAVKDDLRKTYKKCNDISQEGRALICTLLKESSEKDRKLHLSMYGKVAQLEKHMDAKLAWFQEKYSRRTHGGIGCSSSQTSCPLTEKELHQLRMDEEALKEMLEEEAMNKKAQKEKIRQEQAKNDAFFLEFGVVRIGVSQSLLNQNVVSRSFDCGCVRCGGWLLFGECSTGRRLSVPYCNTMAYCATHHCGDWRGSFLEKVAFTSRRALMSCWPSVVGGWMLWGVFYGVRGSPCYDHCNTRAYCAIPLLSGASGWRFLWKQVAFCRVGLAGRFTVLFLSVLLNLMLNPPERTVEVYALLWFLNILVVLEENPQQSAQSYQLPHSAYCDSHSRPAAGSHRLALLYGLSSDVSDVGLYRSEKGSKLVPVQRTLLEEIELAWVPSIFEKGVLLWLWALLRSSDDMPKPVTGSAGWISEALGDYPSRFNLNSLTQVVSRNVHCDIGVRAQQRCCGTVYLQRMVMQSGSSIGMTYEVQVRQTTEEVWIVPDNEDSRARGFVHLSLDL